MAVFLRIMDPGGGAGDIMHPLFRGPRLRTTRAPDDENNSVLRCYLRGHFGNSILDTTIKRCRLV